MDSPPSSEVPCDARRRQEAVVDLGRRALDVDDLDALLNDAVAAVAETLDAAYCCVLETLPPGDEHLFRAGVGWDDGVVGNETVSTAVDAEAGQSWPQPFLDGDGEPGASFVGTDLLEDHGVESGVVVTVHQDDKPWGLLGAFTTAPRSFSEHERGFLQAVANVLASRIETERAAVHRDEIYGRISDGFFALDEEWRFTYLNERAHELINPEGRTLIGEDVWEEFPGAIERSFKPKYERAMYEQETVAFQEYYPEPLDAWFEVRAYPSESGLSVYFRDVTERKEYERELQVRVSQQEIVTDLGEQALAGDDLDELMAEATAAVAETLDCAYCKVLDLDEDAGELLLRQGVGWDDGIVGTATVAADDNSQAGYTLLSEKPVIVEDLPAEDRFTGPALLTSHDVASGISTIVGTSDEPWGILGVHDTEHHEFSEHDVNFVKSVANILAAAIERHRYEAELEATIAELTESNERLEQFAYAASHDLQEPLRMVSSYLQLIEGRYAADLDEDAKEFLAFAVDGAERMRSMIDGLLKYSRVETDGEALEPVDLDGVLADVREDLAVKIRETDAEITAESLPTVAGDSRQLRQVFQNLLDNAMEYSGEEPPRIHVSAARRDSRVVVSVRDEGVGIDPGHADRIFEVFQSLHGPDEHEGTGIGLALCERIVERHGGDIWVDSARGEGATISFTLPAVGDHHE